ncbi:kinase-like domain-containing protein [Mycena alexandri]|uniref:Kinase-like domain-containing protein n=1 Tax=Mycena alexandri TaxID=1745969 RepID=A0AAD6WW58_9AGAR|nr:kinase-like domain-containing protein [Mycena alexandri]
MDAALGTMGVTPVPGLSFAFKLFGFILCDIPEVKASRRQLKVLANTISQLLTTLNDQFAHERLSEAGSAKALADLKSLLEDINQFTRKELSKSFFKALLQKDTRLSNIEDFYRRISMLVNAFQISALVDVQLMLKDDETARNEDSDNLASRLDNLEKNQVELRQALDINQNNMLAMMVSIQRRLDAPKAVEHNPEQQFYAHTLEYLSSTTGGKMDPEDWMVPAFEVDYGTEIGSGGFGTVYRGTWNRTEVAIKVVHQFGGVKANLSLLRKEIDIWLNLRHPNILQFLGANTLDDKPFIMMPYISYNSRRFLERHPDFDPIYILRDVSLGLEYLHSRKICHGDLKGINILVDDLGRCLLCDFGLARLKADITSRTDNVGATITSGSRNWMAPELFEGSRAKPPSDIYAFGMTMYELYADEIPLSSVGFSDFIEVVLRMDVRPQRPDEEDAPRLTDAVWDLAQSCWVKNPKARPTARNIHDTVAHLIKDMDRKTPTGAQTMPEIDAEHARRSSFLPSPRPELIRHSRSATDRYSAGPWAETQAPPPRERASTQSEGSDIVDLISMHNDVQAHNKSGRFSDAQRLGEELVEKQISLFGTDHLDTLRYMFTLAAAYTELHEFSKGQDLTTTVLQKRARILGSEHQDTLRCMSSLAVIQHRMGLLKDAEQLASMVMEKQTRILGGEHPDTLISMHNLSVTYHDLGRPQEAARLQEVVRDARSRLLGIDHADTLSCIFSLAGTYHTLGRFQEAEDLTLVVLEHRTQILGREHPATIRCMFSMAGTYHKQRKFTEAERLATEVVEARTKVLGSEHPETLIALHNLVVITSSDGQSNSAVQLALDLVERETRVLGGAHPQTLRSSALLDSLFELERVN